MYDVKKGYELAKEYYAQYGIDVDKAIEIADKTPISMHCWQGDDVRGFDNSDELSGGIQTTGNYPGAARNPEELMADIDKALSLSSPALTASIFMQAMLSLRTENLLTATRLSPSTLLNG